MQTEYLGRGTQRVTDKSLAYSVDLTKRQLQYCGLPVPDGHDAVVRRLDSEGVYVLEVTSIGRGLYRVLYAWPE